MITQIDHDLGCHIAHVLLKADADVIRQALETVSSDMLLGCPICTGDNVLLDSRIVAYYLEQP